MGTHEVYQLECLCGEKITAKVDVSGLAPGDRQALNRLIAASRLYDGVVMRQLWSGNQALLDGHTAFLPGAANNPAS